MLNIKYYLKSNLKAKIIIILCAIFVLVYWKLLSNLGYETTSTEAPIQTQNKICSVNYNDSRSYIHNDAGLPVIYYVTPSYPRPAQVAELVRLSHTLMHVPRIHWIVADDHPACTDVLLEVLQRSKLPYTHISSPKPFKVKRNKAYARGVSNRLAAVSWLKNNAKEGVLYFGDDDNTVDLRLFEEIRNTKKVSMFPVGLIGKFAVSSPLVKEGKVVGFIDSWLGGRKFPVDMAGFAVNIRFLKPNTRMPYHVGLEEDQFLISLDLKYEDIEPVADNCSKVYVWHTRTIATPSRTLQMSLDDYPRSDNLAGLLNELKRLDKTDATKLISIKPHTKIKGSRKTTFPFDIMEIMNEKSTPAVLKRRSRLRIHKQAK